MGARALQVEEPCQIIILPVVQTWRSIFSIEANEAAALKIGTEFGKPRLAVDNTKSEKKL